MADNQSVWGKFKCNQGKETKSDYYTPEELAEADISIFGYDDDIEENE